MNITGIDLSGLDDDALDDLAEVIREKLTENGVPAASQAFAEVLHDEAVYRRAGGPPRLRDFTLPELEDREFVIVHDTLSVGWRLEEKHGDRRTASVLLEIMEQLSDERHARERRSDARAEDEWGLSHSIDVDADDEEPEEAS